MNHGSFISERISRTAEITLNSNIERVFPLFGPIEEKKWADGWNPVVLYPASEKLEEGMVFITPAQAGRESKYSWIVSGYQPEIHFVEYIVSTANRYWVIKIKCDSLSDTGTKATVTYTFTGMSSLGNRINKHALEQMYRMNLKDREDEINQYLKTGKMLKHHE